MVRTYNRKTEDTWTRDDLLEALTLINEDKCKINDIAEQFGISRATLYRQNKVFKKGNWDVDQTKIWSGCGTVLNKVEEDVLEKTVLDLKGQGFPVTSNDIKRICFEYCESSGIPNQFHKEKRMASDDWFHGYIKRRVRLADYSSNSFDKENGMTRAKRMKKRNAAAIEADNSLLAKKIEVEPEEVVPLTDTDDEEFLPKSGSTDKRQNQKRGRKAKEQKIGQQSKEELQEPLKDAPQLVYVVHELVGETFDSAIHYLYL